MIRKTYLDGGIAQWLECQICDQVLQERWENFLLQVQLSGLTLILVEFSSPGPTFWAYSYFGSHSTFVLPQQHVKDPSHSAKRAGGRLQLWMKWHCKLMHGRMVYTELVPRRQQFHMAPAMQQPNSAVSTLLQWILKICAVKGYSHSFRITCDMSTWSLLETEK